jgi:hypothetical protein
LIAAVAFELGVPCALACVAPNKQDMTTKDTAGKVPVRFISGLPFEPFGVVILGST